MSKKLTLFALGILLGMAVFASPSYARAAGGEQAITPEQAATLKAALDVLGKTLDILEARADAKLIPEAQVPPTKKTLGMLRESLVTLDFALAKSGGAVAVGKPVEAPTTQVVTPDSGVATNDVAIAPADEKNTGEADESQLASILSNLKTKRGVAAAIAALLVLGALAFVGFEYFRHRMRPLPTT